MTTHQTKCHYEILSIPFDADASAIKKAHRRLALQNHPDKNVHKSAEEQAASAAEFKLIQAAYECLSDPTERRWYDEHRELILRGGVASSGDDDGNSYLFDVLPFQYAGCYDGYNDNDEKSFYKVYEMVFREIYEGEKNGYLAEGNIDFSEMANHHLSEVSFGHSKSNWGDVSAFYSAWESFTSSLSFAWEDIYHLDDLREAPNRRIRRLMEEDNKKKRKGAKKERVEDISALVRFVKRRDPRVAQQREFAMQEQSRKEAVKKREAATRKEKIAAAKEEWLIQAEQNMREQEAADLDAGRIRLADLDSDDEYGAKRGRKKNNKWKKCKKNRQIYSDDETDEDCPIKVMTESMNGLANKITNDNNEEESDGNTCPVDTTTAPVATVLADNSDPIEMNVHHSNNIPSNSESSDEEEMEPDSWKCECCRKTFKSEKQFDNHIKSKKHKDTLKHYEKRLQKEAMAAVMNDFT